eukprot:TRINITY_DN1364_c0_g1_i2.p1 TRINITY_DN1364_c0_g1~~TRINITY_DN1364_c0_g1_i2.p1  ORF type:complete len:896 (-),score=158.70 TRINITY_DN1364_c0_g1_i2:105-2792(-)
MADMGYSFAAAPSSVPVPVRSVKEVHIVTKSRLLQDHEKQEKLRASIPATQGTLSPNDENGAVINAWATPEVGAPDAVVVDLAQENPEWIEDDPSARFDRLPQPFRRVASIVEGLLTNVYHHVDHNAQLRATDPVYLSTQAEEKLEPTTASEIIPLEGFHVGAVCGVHRRDQFSTMLGCSDGGVRMLRQGLTKEALVWSGVPTPGEEEEEKGRTAKAEASTNPKDKGKSKGKDKADKGKGKGDKKKGKAEKDSRKPAEPEPVANIAENDPAGATTTTDGADPNKYAVKCIAAVPTTTMDIICAVWIRHQVIVIRLDSGGDCHVEQKIDVSGEEVASLKFSTNAVYLLISYSTSDTIEVYVARPQILSDGDGKSPAGSTSTSRWDDTGSDVPSHRTPLFTIPRPPSSQEIDAQLAADTVQVLDPEEQANAKNAKGGKGGKGGKGAKKEAASGKGGKGTGGGKKDVPKRGGGGGAKAPKGAVVIPDEGTTGDISARDEHPTPAPARHTGEIALLHDGHVVISWQGLLDVRTYTLPAAVDIPAIPAAVPSTAQDTEGAQTLPALLADGHYLLPATPTCNAVDQDKQQVAFGLTNGGAAVLDAVNKRMYRSVGECLKSDITAITFDRSGTLALGSQQGAVAFTSVHKSGEDAPKQVSNKTPAAPTLYLVPVAAGHVLSVAADAGARVLDVRDGHALRVLPFKSVHDCSAGPLLCTSDGGGSLVVVAHHHDGSASLQLFDSLQSHTELILDFGGGRSSVQYEAPGRDMGGVGAGLGHTSGASSVAGSLNLPSALSRPSPTPVRAGNLNRGSSGSLGPTRSRPYTLTPNASRTRHVRVADGTGTSLSQQVSQVVPRSQLPPGATPLERARAGVRDVVQDRASRTMRVQMRRNVLKEIAAER